MARQKSTIITAECYGIKKTFRSKKAAMAFFLDCMMNSEGAEHERYESIYFQLSQGKTEVSDQINWRRLT